MRRPFPHQFNLVVLAAFTWGTGLPALWALARPESEIWELILLSIISIIIGAMATSIVLSGLMGPKEKP